MINLYIREHGTHNMGWSFDFKADLDNYTSDTQLLDDLFEYTRTCIIENGLDYDDLMEEWLITDYEFESDFSMNIDEYTSLSKLVEMNNFLKDMSNIELKLITALIGDGFSFEEAYNKVNEDEVLYYEGALEDWCYEMVEEGLFGEVSEALKPFINYKDMAFALGANDGYSEYDDSLSYCAY